MDTDSTITQVAQTTTETLAPLQTFDEGAQTDNPPDSDTDDDLYLINSSSSSEEETGSDSGEEKDKELPTATDGNSIFIGLRVYAHQDAPAMLTGQLKKNREDEST